MRESPMKSTHLFELRAWNAPSILPRISLVLSRRRLTPQRLQFSIGSDPRFCSFELAIECDARTAERLRAQLAKVVELVEVSMRPAAAALEPVIAASSTAAA
jgi:acetolactate synthase regulatory subunit